MAKLELKGKFLTVASFISNLVYPIGRMVQIWVWGSRLNLCPKLDGGFWLSKSLPSPLFADPRGSCHVDATLDHAPAAVWAAGVKALIMSLSCSLNMPRRHRIC
eukprot:c13644_g1_i1 orf=2-310(-)